MQDYLDDIIDKVVAPSRKKPARPSPAPARGGNDELDSIIDEVMSGRQQSQPTPTPQPAPMPQPTPTPREYIPLTERQEFNYPRPLDLDASLKQASQRRIKAEGALQEKARSIKLRPDWRTPAPIEGPVSKGQVQGPPVFKPQGEPLKPGTTAKVGSMNPQDFNPAEIERRIVETVSDPTNASRFTADEWAAMEVAARNVAEREAEEQRQSRVREIEDQRQLDKANAPSYPAQLVNRFMRGATGTVMSSIRGASLLHPAMAADLRQKGVLQTPQQFEETMRSLAPVDPTDESLLSKGAEVLGGAVPVVGASALGGMAGLPSWIAPAVLGAATNAGQTYDEAVAAGEDPEKAKQAAIVGALIGLTEGLGVGRLGGKAPSIASVAGRGALSRIGLTAAKGFGEEGLQEAFNRALSNINAKIVSGYDPNRAISEGVVQSFLLGGGVGGLFSGGIGVASAATAGRPSRSKRYTEALEAKPMEALAPRRAEAANTAPFLAEAVPTAPLPQIAPEPQLGQTTRRLQPQPGAPPIRGEMNPTELTAIENAQTTGIPAPRAAQSQPATTPAVRAGAEEMTPGFREDARRQTLAMTGLSPEAIEAEMAKLPRTSEPTTAPQPATKTAPDEPRSQGTILGSGLGSLQPMLENVKLPSRAEVSETAGSVQTAAQLGNPRFVIRNVLQHLVYGKQERAATRLAATLDWAYSKATGKPRQIAAPSGSDLQSYARNWSKAVEAYKAGRPLPGKPNADYITADANKLGRAVGKVMAWVNEIPDAANWQTRFEGALQSIVAASKKSKSPLDADAVIDQAWMEANHAALRDSNFASEGMQKIKQGFNTLSSPIFGTDKFGVGDFILKYAQTPGALLKRGLERSPLGLFQVAKDATTPGQFRRRNTLLALSRVAEGAATGIGLGAALAAGGILVGPEEENRTGQAMEREEGVRGYSLNTSALVRFFTGESTEMREGDTLYSIDWAQPWAMNLSAGAALMNLHKRGKLGPGSAAGATGEAVYNSLAKTLDVMGDQSVLKNLTKYASRVQGETEGDKWLNALKAVGLDVPSSFVPSLARQARQVVDPYERDTRAEQPGGFEGFVSEATNRALAQLPGVSQAFPTRPSYLTGQDKKTAFGEMSVPARIAAQLSPGNISTYAPKPIAREVDRLREAGFDVALGMPKRRLFEPTSALREREQQFAIEFSDAAKRLIGHPLYNEYVDEVKARALNNLAKYLRESTTKELRERTIEGIISAAAKGAARRDEKEQQ